MDQTAFLIDDWHVEPTRDRIRRSGHEVRLEPRTIFLVEPIPSSNTFFAAWFTFDATSAKVGTPEHRVVYAPGQP